MASSNANPPFKEPACATFPHIPPPPGVNVNTKKNEDDADDHDDEDYSKLYTSYFRIPPNLCMHLRQLSFPAIPFVFRRRRRGFLSLMLSTRNVLVAATLLVLLGLLTLTPSQPLSLKQVYDAAPPPKFSRQFQISNKVAAIADTSFTPRHVPLLMHYSGVLGPEWPIVYYTSQETYNTYLKPGVANVSKVWTRALSEGRIQVRFLPTRFEMTSRSGVNSFLADKWMWEDLAPAKHVLIFQADAIICGNAHKTVDDFLEWDFIGATLAPEGRMYNGGLSLRNRDMVLRILNANDYQKDTAAARFKFEGEDVWYSKHMDLIGAKLPSNEVALEFACEYHFHIKAQKQPMGYHKVHKAAPSKIDEISEWCPEIHLAAPGKLGKS
ncbi:hypothetical protein TWF730_004389 [Orbilia blumenaviensis]|uniref:DUF5672 domain-containing protein n=1 Tax=Orbilia blumenaviensis TaxID=1796055 RepID=A0AAV9TYL2_9PEZI